MIESSPLYSSGFNMQFTTIEVPGAQALKTLNERRTQFAATGRYPFLIGEAENFERLCELDQINRQDQDEIIRASFDVDISDWLAIRRRELEEFDLTDDEIVGVWPAEISGEPSLTLHLDIVSRKILPRVVIGLAEVEHPWQLPAKLRYGNWNECPPAEVHCAIHRDWQARFGAEIAGVSADTVECIVASPPQDEEQATSLAWEQYLYCEDIVIQGCQTISNLAATLLDSPYWYFWWD
jgi:hypothetical protein